MSDDSEELKLWSSLHNIPMITLDNLFFKEISYLFRILGERVYDYHFVVTMNLVIFMTFLGLLNYWNFCNPCTYS